MAIIQNMQSAWHNDSFYMQTASKNGVDILKAGAVGFLASRISGVGLPRNLAISFVIGTISDIFSDFIGNKAKKYLTKDSEAKLDTHEKALLSFLLYKIIRSVGGMSMLGGILTGKQFFSWKNAEAVVKFFVISLIVNVVIDETIVKVSNYVISLFSPPQTPRVA